MYRKPEFVPYFLTRKVNTALLLYPPYAPPVTPPKKGEALVQTAADLPPLDSPEFTAWLKDWHQKHNG